MLQVAIVEDELFMREFLESCISYRELGFELCGSFCCAEDALEGLQTAKADLVITDIKMPGMDGIRFMSELLKINPETHFIVISNYQDFEIVRSAFRIGICDYIPKIDFEIEHYRDLLLSFASGKAPKEEPVKPEQSGRLKERFWGEEDFVRTGSVDNISEQKLIFALFDILNYEDVACSYWQMDKEQLKSAVSACLDEAVKELGYGEFFFNEYDKVVLLFSGTSISAIQEFLLSLRTTLQTEFEFKICIFLEETPTKLRQLKVQYAELCALKKYRFFLPESGIITKKATTHFNDSFDYMKTYSEIEALFQSNELDTVLKKLEELSKLQPAAECTEEVLFFYQNMYMLVGGYAKAHQLELTHQGSVSKLFSVLTCEQVTEQLMHDIKKIAQHIFFPEKKLNQQIDEYLQKHYAEKITLEEMAKYFQYEYSYFSKMFRRIKGVTFRKYLNNIRLEQAHHLIQYTSLKYSEIAVNVGYQNYEHFSRCFREKYGCWPNEIERTVADD